MTTRLHSLLALGLLLGCAAPGNAQTPAPAPAPAATPATKPALYTEAQAQLGKTVFAAECAACHGANLEGRFATALTGEEFRDITKSRGWNGQRIFEGMSNGMPRTAPGTLKPEEYAALMALILQKNGYPAGDKPLVAGEPGLAGVEFGKKDEAESKK